MEFACFLIYRYESLTFSYPQIEKEGISALVNLLSDALTQSKPFDAENLFPSFFKLDSAFLDGLKYCLTKYVYSTAVRL